MNKIRIFLWSFACIASVLGGTLYLKKDIDASRDMLIVALISANIVETIELQEK